MSENEVQKFKKLPVTGAFGWCLSRVVCEPVCRHSGAKKEGTVMIESLEQFLGAKLGIPWMSCKLMN